MRWRSPTGPRSGLGGHRRSTPALDGVSPPLNATGIKNQVEYDETIWDARDAEREKKLEAKLKQQAKQLGNELVPVEPKAA